jgi:protein-S-isoprenylcysteine O-methyltransferase Ste14
MALSLILKAFAALVIVLSIFGAALFLSAGTFDYWQGWVFLSVYFIVTTLITLFLIKTDPALFGRRMRGGPFAEKRSAQRLIMLCASLGFIALFVVAGFDHRLAWSYVPTAAVLAGDAMIVLGFVIIFIVFRENTFASSTIELSEGQKVISTGVYSLIRHPMYFGAMIFILGIPLALGSLWTFVVLVPFLPIMNWRMDDEETFLSKNLKGYAEYCTKVKYRLIPGLY